MTAEEAFRFGFLHKCAAAGLPPEAADRMLSAVEGDQSKCAGVVGDVLTSPLKVLPYAALTTLIGSGGLGYLARRATSPPFNAQDARDEELAETFRQNTDRLRLARIGRHRAAANVQPQI